MFLLLLLAHVVSICVYVSTTMLRMDVTTSQCWTSLDPVYGGNLTNCSGRGISQLPLSGLPDNITTLILSNNNIPRLGNHFFYLTSLSSLRQLTITASRVAAIEVDALFSLDNLEILDLEHNDLPLCPKRKRSFPAGMFKHVPNLRHLFIGFNNKDDDCPSGRQAYPDNIDIFSWLPHLTNLSIDTVNNTLYLGSEFSNLTQLTNLTVVCRPVLYIHNHSLYGLRHLKIKVLNLIYFRKSILTFGVDIFQNMSHLMYLTLEGSQVGNHNIMNALRHLANRTMPVLKLIKTNFYLEYSIPKHAFRDGVIGYNLAKYLRSICVTHFTWSDSVLFAFKPNSITTDAWPECLRTADLSHNKLEHIGWLSFVLEVRRLKYLSEISLSSIGSPPSSQYPKLVHYNLSESSSSSHLGHVDNDMDSKSTSDGHLQQIWPGSQTSDNINKYFHLASQSMKVTNLNKSNGNINQKSQSPFALQQPRDIGKLDFPYNGNITLYFIPSLKKLKVINLIFGPITAGSMTLVCQNCANFEELYWVNNDYLEARGVIYGMQSLKVLDLSGSYFAIPENLFDTFRGLQVLVLSDIKPDTFFKQISVQRILRNLTNLKYLDVSNNKLNSLLFPPTTFSISPQVTHVILSQNRFSSIPFDLDTTPNLRVLDLSANAIFFLTDEEMEALNNHVARVGDFFLRLQDNGLACVCSQMNLLVWTFTTDVTIDQWSDLECVTEDGQMMLVDGLSDIPTYYRACQGRMFLMASLVLVSVMVVVFLLAYLITRFRTAIEAFLLRMVVRTFRPMRPEDYKKGVFMGYADDDHRFVKHVLLKYVEGTLGLTTFTHQRDLGPGHIDQQFIEAIRDSWRVLLLLSKTFLMEYHMADIVMKYATHSVTSVNQRRVFVLVEAAQVLNIPDYLHDVLDETQIIILPDLHHQLDYVQKQSIKQCLRASQ